MKLVIILLTILLTCCTLPVIEPEPIINDPEYRGLFIGVNDYIYLPSLDLPSPAKNTERLKSLFEKCAIDGYPFTIIETLTGKDATKQNILDKILKTFGDADDNDVSYFYFMGHGNFKWGNPVIAPADYQYTLETSITSDELEGVLDQIKGTKVIFLETCHSGVFISRGDIPLLLNKENYQVLTSSAGGQSTYDNPDGYSYFCKALIRGMENLRADANKDGIVTMDEIYRYIKNHVNRQTVQVYPFGSEFPVYQMKG